jgi:L-alanine-DL-glutamate epimerase-like enolase superfamily enzyme
MKIVSVEAIPVRVPRERPDQSSFGTRAYTEAGVVRIETDTGITGWGEICLVWWRMGSGLCGDVNRLLAPALLGEDPRAVSMLWDRMRLALPGREDAPAVAGVEMALLDICGKAAGVPVHDLLGGAYRDRIPVSYSLHIKAPAEMAAEAARYASAGYGTLKVKMGRTWAEDLASLAAVREAVGPHVSLRVDVNGAWTSVSEAVRRITEMRDYDVELVEQPLHGDNRAGMAELRRISALPIAADESVWNMRDALEITSARAADVLNLYFSEAGGLLQARAIAEIARSSGMAVWVGSMPELGLGTAANAHLAAAIPALELASDVCGFAYHADDILTAPLVVEQGSVAVPTGPGLGVEIDPKALTRLRMEDP